MLGSDRQSGSDPIQYERAPLRVRCAMLHKHPPVDPVLSCLSCFRKPSVGVCQVVSNSPDPGIAWPSSRFPPDLWRWFGDQLYLTVTLPDLNLSVFPSIPCLVSGCRSEPIIIHKYINLFNWHWHYPVMVPLKLRPNDCLVGNIRSFWEQSDTIGL